jgi:hypothetical protein
VRRETAGVPIRFVLGMYYVCIRYVLRMYGDAIRERSNVKRERMENKESNSACAKCKIVNVRSST